MLTLASFIPSSSEDTGDTRESASITLINNFFAEAANVNVYDPEVKEAQIWNDLAETGGNVEACESRSLRSHASRPDHTPAADALLSRFVSDCADKKKITVTQTALEACEGAAAIVIATEWDEFKTLDWTAVYAKMSKPAFVVSISSLAIASTRP